MVPKKVLQAKREDGVTKVDAVPAIDKPQLSEEELDKTIEDLVIS